MAYQVPPFLSRKGDSLIFNKKEGYLDCIL